MNALSTTDALKLFHDDMLTKKAGEQSEPAEVGVSVGGLQEQSSNSDSLGSYTTELQSLLLESPEIKNMMTVLPTIFCGHYSILVLALVRIGGLPLSKGNVTDRKSVV